MTDDILVKIKQRDHFKSIHDTEHYRLARNACVNLIKQSKIDYYKSCIENNKGDSKKLWKYIRELAPKDCKLTPSIINDGNKIITNLQDISECFNTFFSSIVEKYLPEQNKSPNLGKLQNFISSKLSTNYTFSIPLMQVDKVE